MKFYGVVHQGWQRKELCDFDSDPDHHAACPVGNPLNSTNYEWIAMK